ncbi:hypothetical protein LJC46_04860 [Desulfovibrio sp. OttesenSCG-928-G15]|nr:hypothetical protein [Desulfovibrio sp. OttesenSCG-928-G15]
MSTASPSPAAPAAPGLEESKALLARSRVWGKISAVIFLFAALAVVDALQSLVRHEFNSVDLVPGETILLSGMLPVSAKGIDDIAHSIEGNSGLSFTPVETYKGFWMGGHMWRAELAAAADAAPGKAVLVIEDSIPPKSDNPQNFDARDRAILFGGQQNPALVFNLTVWASEAQRRSGNTSLVRRMTGLPAFGLAAALVFLALLAGFLNWRTYSKAEVALARHGVYCIHGLKEQLPEKGGPLVTPGYKAAFALAGTRLDMGDSVVLYDRTWAEQGRGRVVELNKGKAFALFPQSGVRPQYGWLVSRKDLTV